MDISRAIHSDQITEPKEYSSLPLVLALSSAILLCAAGGWFLLNRDTAEPIDDDDDALTLAIVSEEMSIDAAPIEIDSELRKARLAADADFLVFPSEQSALYFYGRVMAADPEHPVATAEFDAVLARISLIVTGHLATGRFDDAYRLAVLVSRHKPDHPIVENTRETLNSYAARLVDEAIQHTREGNDDDAAAVLAIAEELPGLNSEYFAAVRDSIAEIKQSRIAAEGDRLEDARLAAEVAIIEWTEKVRGAISSGRLVAPAGYSARDYLAERDSPAEIKEELTSELLAALMTAAQQSIDTDNLADAESYLYAADEFSDDDGKSELRDTLESKLIEAEGNKVVGLGNFVRVKSVPARYPRRANKYNITGWVDVAFTVTSTGATSDIEILQSEPENTFEKSAIEAVEQWAFQPREYRGQPIDQRTAAKVVFRLE